MKQISSKLLLVGIMIISTTSVKAQFLQKLGERVKERAKARTEEKVDQKTDQAMDSLFSKKRKERNTKETEEESSASEPESKKMNSSKEYRFEFTATIEVENYDKKKTQKNTIVQSYGEGALLSTVEKNTMIHDFGQEMVYMIDSTNMQAQAISLSWFMKRMGGGAKMDDDQEMKVTKTGRTEIINGYTSYEYIIEHEDGKVEAWHAPDVNFDYSDYMQGFSKMFSKKSTVVPPSDQGYVMRMIAFDKDGKKITQMEVVDLEDSSKTIALSDYQVTKLF